MASGKRRRVDANEFGEDTASDDHSPTSTSSAPSEDTEQPVKRRQLGADSSSSPVSTTSIRCGLPPHAELEFPDWHSYEVHYQQNHVNRCSECHKNFPTEHFLELHIAENHDPITALQRERGEKTYACFVEGCDKICATPQKRRLHLTDKHGFPKLYDFFIVNNGIDRRTSMLRGDRGRKPWARRGENSKPAIASDEDEEKMEEDEHEEAVSTLTKSMSTLKFVPRSLQFGRGSSKTFMR